MNTGDQVRSSGGTGTFAGGAAPGPDAGAPGAVVVGVDGSPESLAALDLGAREASLRGVRLLVVHGLVQPVMQVLTDPPPGSPELQRYAEHLVADAVGRARALVPGVEVTGRVIPGSGAHALITTSPQASVVVVGDRGLGAFAGLVVGSVAVHVASHARCPVLVARGAVDPELPVLLAADGSPANEPAVAFAFAAAAVRDVALVAQHVLVDEEDTGLLGSVLAPWQQRYPKVQVHQQVGYGHVRRTIIEAARSAQLVVVGARGHGGFTGLLLGSVGQAVLRHATCPTAIVPQAHQR
ncbi:MAG TPA: universal stress protein [Micromonosporaceae bacterium]